MGRLACLPMYDFPERRAAHDALWQAIAERLRRAGVPDVPDGLTRSEDLPALWRDPTLLLGQSCGYPLMTGLAGQVHLVATPSYRAPGCQGALHCSAIIVRAEDEAADLPALRGRRCAINGWDSNTGMNLLRAAIAPFATHGVFFRSVTVSFSHRNSLSQVASGAVDVAAIDCVTLEQLRRLEPALVAKTRVLAWTEPTPALPLICSAATDAPTLEALRAALADVAAAPALSAIREALLIDGFIELPIDAYAGVLSLQADAVARGYPLLA